MGVALFFRHQPNSERLTGELDVESSMLDVRVDLALTRIASPPRMALWQ